MTKTDKLILRLKMDGYKPRLVDRENYKKEQSRGVYMHLLELDNDVYVYFGITVDKNGFRGRFYSYFSNKPNYHNNTGLAFILSNKNSQTYILKEDKEYFNPTELKGLERALVRKYCRKVIVVNKEHHPDYEWEDRYIKKEIREDKTDVNNSNLSTIYAVKGILAEVESISDLYNAISIIDSRYPEAYGLLDELHDIIEQATDRTLLADKLKSKDTDKITNQDYPILSTVQYRRRLEKHPLVTPEQLENILYFRGGAV